MHRAGVRTDVSYRESDSAFVTVTVEDEQLMDAERVQNATGLIVGPDLYADGVRQRVCR